MLLSEDLPFPVLISHAFGMLADCPGSVGMSLNESTVGWTRNCMNSGYTISPLLSRSADVEWEWFLWYVEGGGGGLGGECVDWRGEVL